MPRRRLVGSSLISSCNSPSIQVPHSSVCISLSYADHIFSHTKMPTCADFFSPMNGSERRVPQVSRRVLAPFRHFFSAPVVDRSDQCCFHDDGSHLPPDATRQLLPRQGRPLRGAWRGAIDGELLCTTRRPRAF